MKHLVLTLFFLTGVCFSAEDVNKSCLVDRLSAGYKVEGIISRETKIFANGHVTGVRAIYLSETWDIEHVLSYVTLEGKPTGVGKCVVRNIGHAAASFTPSELVTPKENALKLAGDGGTAIVAVSTSKVETIKPGEQITIWIQTMIEEP